MQKVIIVKSTIINIVNVFIWLNEFYPTGVHKLWENSLDFKIIEFHFLRVQNFWLRRKILRWIAIHNAMQQTPRPWAHKRQICIQHFLLIFLIKGFLEGNSYAKIWIILFYEHKNIQPNPCIMKNFSNNLRREIKLLKYMYLPKTQTHF